MDFQASFEPQEDLPNFSLAMDSQCILMDMLYLITAAITAVILCAAILGFYFFPNELYFDLATRTTRETETEP